MALQDVIFILDASRHNPSVLQQFTNIDYSYSSLLRVCVEVHQKIMQEAKAREELEEGEEEEGELPEAQPESNEMRNQLEALFRAGVSMKLDLAWPTV